jgi:hypothetical protein
LTSLIVAASNAIEAVGAGCVDDAGGGEGGAWPNEPFAEAMEMSESAATVKSFLTKLN